MITTNKAFKIKDMTNNAQQHLIAAEQGLLAAIMKKQKSYDLTTLWVPNKPILTDADYGCLLDWFSDFDYEVDRERRTVLIPESDDET